MAQSDVTKNFRDGTITIRDGGALSFEVDIEIGNFTSAKPKDSRIPITDRGRIVGLRKGQQAVGNLSFDVDMRQFTSAVDATIIDVVKQTGTWATAVSTGGAAFEQFLVDIEYKAEGVVHGDASDHRETYKKVHLDVNFKEGDRNTLTISGEVYSDEDSRS